MKTMNVTKQHKLSAFSMDYLRITWGDIWTLVSGGKLEGVGLEVSMKERRNDIEFSKGDKVTFQAYREKIPAVVVDVDVKKHLFGFQRDERIWYRLSGAGMIPLVTTCTGAVITESIYFKTE